MMSSRVHFADGLSSSTTTTRNSGIPHAEYHRSTATMLIEHWDTYEHELYMFGHGHPLWNADAFQEFQEVQIGDVGYACGGKVWRAFNVFYGDTSGRNSFPVREGQFSGPVRPSVAQSFVPGTFHPPDPNRWGVPFGHVPWDIPSREVKLVKCFPQDTHIRTHREITGASSGVVSSHLTPIPRETGGYSTSKFIARRLREAELTLVTDAECWKAPIDLFQHYAQTRWESWRTLPQDGKCFHNVSPQKLTFIYGTTKTKAWSTLAYEEIGWERVGRHGVPDLSGSRQFGEGRIGIPGHQRGPCSFYRDPSHHSTVLNATTNPEVHYFKRNQTVFVHRLMTCDRAYLGKLRQRIYKICRWDKEHIMKLRKAHDRERLMRRTPNGRSKGSQQGSQLTHHVSPPIPFRTIVGSCLPSSGATETKRAWAGSGNTASMSATRQGNVSRTVADLAIFGMYPAVPRDGKDMNKVNSFDITEHGTDPLDILLVYILEVETTSSRAVVSDDEACGLLKVYASLHRGDRPDNMAKLLHELRPDTYVDLSGCGRVAVPPSDVPGARREVNIKHRKETPASKHKQISLQETSDTVGVTASTPDDANRRDDKSPDQRVFTLADAGIEHGVLSSVLDSRLAFWTELVRRSAILCDDIYTRTPSVQVFQDRANNLRYHCFELLDAFKAFVSSLTREDLASAGRRDYSPAVSLFMDTVSVFVSIHATVRRWSTWSCFTSTLRFNEVRCALNNFQQVMRQHQVLYLEARGATDPPQLAFKHISQELAKMEVCTDLRGRHECSLEYLESFTADTEKGDRRHAESITILKHRAQLPSGDEEEDYSDDDEEASDGEEEQRSD